MKNKLIIIDEAHNLKFKPNLFKRKKNKDEDEDPFTLMEVGKSMPSKVSKLFIEACGYAKKVLLLTATPVLNRPDEIINMIAMVNGESPKKFFYFVENIYGEGKRKEDFDGIF